MTIIKVSKDGKKLFKKVDELVVPLHVPDDVEAGGRVMHVEMMPSERSKRLVNVFLLIIALLVLTAGMVGGVYLYKYMAHRHKVSKVTIQYVDGDMPKAMPQREGEEGFWCGTIDEEVDIMADYQVEKIDVPKFDDCSSSVVIHDFHTNTSVIVDNDDSECFIMDLDRTQMSPPRSFAELITKYASGYYMPKVDVVRRDYHVVTPPLTDLSFAGETIKQECLGYASYKLEKNEPPQMLEIQFYLKRKVFKTFGYSDLRQVVKDRIFK